MDDTCRTLIKKCITCLTKCKYIPINNSLNKGTQLRALIQKSESLVQSCKRCLSKASQLQKILFSAVTHHPDVILETQCHNQLCAVGRSFSVLDSAILVTKKGHFFSSDESEEEEDHKKKFKIKIKPLPADQVVSVPSVDELKASIGNIALSPSPMVSRLSLLAFISGFLCVCVCGASHCHS